MSYVPTPNTGKSIAFRAVKSYSIKEPRSYQPKIKKPTPLKELPASEKERIDLFYRRQYLKKLAGDKPAPIYSIEEITKILENAKK